MLIVKSIDRMKEVQAELLDNLHRPAVAVKLLDEMVRLSTSVSHQIAVSFPAEVDALRRRQMVVADATP